MDRKLEMALLLMGKGMLGIFVVIIIITLMVALLGHFDNKKAKKIEDAKEE